jgi:hypothetical protein
MAKTNVSPTRTLGVAARSRAVKVALRVIAAPTAYVT